jgi:hypothetical protein
VAGGLITHVVLAEAGLLIGTEALFLVLAAALTVLSGAWHIRGRQTFPGDRQSVQANRALAFRGRLGLFYFGGLLGVAFLTEMSTPLLYVGAALSLAEGWPWAAAYGVGFGVGRAAPALVAACMRTSPSPDEVSRTFTLANRRRGRRVGIAASGALLVVVGLAGLGVLSP